MLVWRRPQDYGELIAHPVDDTELTRSAADRLAAALAEAGDGHPGVDVTRVVLEGDPARALCERADGADLLVVGAHHHHRLASALLGSIGSRVERHCPCPLVVVPHRAQPGADRP